MLTPLPRLIPRLVATAIVCAGGFLLAAAPVRAAVIAGPTLTVTVTDLDASGGASVRAGHHLRYDLAWASNTAAYDDALVNVELDGSAGTQLLTQLIAGGNGVVASALNNQGAGSVSSITWDLGQQPVNAGGVVSWTAVISGDPAGAVPAICTGGTLAGPYGSAAATAIASPACTVASAACGATPALTITGPTSLQPSARGSYTLSVRATGALNKAVIGLQVPAGFVLAASNPQITMQGGLPAFDLGALAAGATATATFDLVAPATAQTLQVLARLVGVPVDGSCAPPNVTVTRQVAVVALNVGTVAGSVTASPVVAVVNTAPVTAVISTPNTGVGSDLLGRILLGALLMLAGLMSLGLRIRRRDAAA